MRDILFRGKNIEANVWEYGDLVRNADGETFIRENYQGMYIFRKVHPETVGQYTGLKDHSGNMIYEGDILIDPFDPDEALAEVIWLEERAGFYIKITDGYYYGAENMDLYKLIGNRWDNPELIK